MKNLIMTMIVGAIVLTGLRCEKNPAQLDYDRLVSVFGYLWGGEKLDSTHAILITWTQPITGYYDPAASAVTDARVRLIDENRGRIYALHPDPIKLGYFYNDSLRVESGTTYRLEIEAEGRRVTASTTVPPRLQITTPLNPDSLNLVRQENLGYEKPLFLRCESLEQIVLVDIYCNEEYFNAEYIHPFSEKERFPQSQEEYDGGRDAEPRHIRAFMKYQDLVAAEFGGQPVVYWYDAMIAFYGSYTLQVLAIDANFHNYLYREHPERSGGIQGGIGVFASISGEKYSLMVQR